MKTPSKHTGATRRDRDFDTPLLWILYLIGGEELFYYGFQTKNKFISLIIDKGHRQFTNKCILIALSAGKPVRSCEQESISRNATAARGYRSKPKKIGILFQSLIENYLI